MRAARTLREFVEAPVGRFWRRERYLAWCAAPSLAGTVHWGQPTDGDMHELVQLLSFVRGTGVRPPLDIVSDARLAQMPAPESYEFVAESVGALVAELPRLVRRHALVHGSGLRGASVAGFFPLTGGATAHAWRLFAAPEEAFDWLARPDTGPIAREVAALVAEALSLPHAPVALAQLLDGAHSPASLDEAARALGCSARTLQRHLAAAGTSFRKEAAAARIRSAAALLKDPELKLDLVARRAGYASLPAFSRAYQRVMGETPSQTRANHLRPR